MGDKTVDNDYSSLASGSISAADRVVAEGTMRQTYIDKAFTAYFAT